MLFRFLPTIVACLATFVAAPSAAGVGASPNVVLIVADDLGYSDVGCFGAQGIKTPHLDRLAREGTRFTSFYVSQAVCTASRASLMSGCYANRIGLQGALNHTSPNGINPDEWLLPEVFKARGYVTACYGKWHLGLEGLGAMYHGFDDFFGIPYSNDNGPFHPVIKDMPALPLMEGGEVIALNPDQSQFTRQFTEKAVNFIRKNRDQPFFLYVPHACRTCPSLYQRSSKGTATRVSMEMWWKSSMTASARSWPR